MIGWLFPCVAVLIWSFNLGESKQLALLDENDVVILIFDLETSQTIQDGCPSEQTYASTTSTPIAISQAINKTFSSLVDEGITANFQCENVTSWIRAPYSGPNCVTQIVYCINERLPVETQIIYELVTGYYIWIITHDLQITFGKVINSIEFGVKHIALANQRGVYAAGELRVSYFADNNTKQFEWNLDSGTFVRDVYNFTQKSILENATQYIWNQVKNEAINANYTYNIDFNFGVSLQFNSPNLSYFGELCNDYPRLYNIDDWTYLIASVNDTDIAVGSPCEDSGSSCFNITKSAHDGASVKNYLFACVFCLFVIVALI